MKKIITQEQKEKKNKRNQIILGGILIFLMVVSTAGFSLINSGSYNNQGSTEEYEYNGVKFTQNTGYWSFQVNGNNFLTVYNPGETDGINITNSLSLDNYIGKPLYFDSNSSEAVSEIAQNLNGLVLRAQNACINSEECVSDYPIKSCSADNIIVVREPKDGEDERIYQQQNCIFIIASNDNQIKYGDRLLFEIIGV